MFSNCLDISEAFNKAWFQAFFSRLPWFIHHLPIIWISIFCVSVYLCLSHSYYFSIKTCLLGLYCCPTPILFLHICDFISITTDHTNSYACDTNLNKSLLLCSVGLCRPYQCLYYQFGSHNHHTVKKLQPFIIQCTKNSSTNHFTQIR